MSRKDVLAATGAVAGCSAVALANYYSTKLDVDIYIEENIDFRLSVDVYWRTDFSDNSVDKLERLFIENSRDQR